MARAAWFVWGLQISGCELGERGEINSEARALRGAKSLGSGEMVKAAPERRSPNRS
jgi:hypothetical protein